MSIIDLFKSIRIRRCKLSEAKMVINELYSFIEEYYDYKCQMIGINSEKDEVNLILYDSFSITCGFDEHGSFGAILNLPNNIATTYFLGFDCSLIENNEKSIKDALKKIDSYCQLRLPDKFLKKYDKVYKKNGHYIDY